MTTPQELAAEAIAAAERTTGRQALCEQICADRGLPADFANRLVGDDAGALKADADDLATALGIPASFEARLLGASKAERNQKLIELVEQSS